MEIKLDPLIVIILIGVITIIGSIVSNNRKIKGMFDERYISRIFNKYLSKGNLTSEEKFYILRAIYNSSRITVSYYNRNTSTRELFITATPKGITFKTSAIISQDMYNTYYVKYNEPSFDVNDLTGTVLTDLIYLCSRFLLRPKQKLLISSIRVSVLGKYDRQVKTNNKMEGI